MVSKIRGSRIKLFILFIYVFFVLISGMPTTPVDYYVGYGFAIAALTGLYLYSIAILNVTKFQLDTRFLLPIILISILYIISGINSYLTGDILFLQFISVLMISIIVFTNVFLLPRIISIKQFSVAISTLSAFSVLVGIPPLILGEYTLLGFEFAPYGWAVGIGNLTSIDGLNSYYQYINGMNQLAIFGLFCTIIRDQYETGKIIPVLLLINTVGVVLSARRAGVLVLITTIPIIAVYYRGYVNTSNSIAMYFLTVFIFGFTIFSITTIHGSIPVVDMSSRISIWQSMIEGISENPFLGTPRSFTTSPHNGYLRVGLTSGIIGTIIYILFILRVVDIRGIDVDRIGLLLTASVFVSVIHQFFFTYNIFGVNRNSMIPQIMIGLLIYHYHSGNSHTPNK